MAIDAGIYAQYARPVKSVGEYQAEMDAQEQNKLLGIMRGQQIQQNQQAMDQQKQAQAYTQQRRNALQGILSSTQDETKLGGALRSGGFFDEAEKVEKGRQEQVKSQAEFAKNFLDVSRQALGSIQANPSKQMAMSQVALLEQLHPGNWSQQYKDQIAALPDDPAAIRNWAIGHSMEVSKQAEAFAPKLKEVRLGNRVVFIDENPYSPTYNTEVSKQSVGVSPDAVLSAETAKRGQDLADARGRESNQIKAAEVAAGGKPPPGYRWNGDGSLEAIKGGPGDKLPESQQKQVIGTQNVSTAIDEYRKQLEGWNPSDIAKPDARAAMGTKYKNLMLQAKEAYNLGVLNGPDLEILQSVITDPASVKGAITSKSALDNQAAELKRIMNNMSRVASVAKPQNAPAGGAKPTVSNW